MSNEENISSKHCEAETKQEAVKVDKELSKLSLGATDVTLRLTTETSRQSENDKPLTVKLQRSIEKESTIYCSTSESKKIETGSSDLQLVDDVERPVLDIQVKYLVCLKQKSTR